MSCSNIALVIMSFSNIAFVILLYTNTCRAIFSCGQGCAQQQLSRAQNARVGVSTGAIPFLARLVSTAAHPVPLPTSHWQRTFLPL